jgi:hypothetical protein
MVVAQQQVYMLQYFYEILMRVHLKIDKEMAVNLKGSVMRIGGRNRRAQDNPASRGTRFVNL